MPYLIKAFLYQALRILPNDVRRFISTRITQAAFREIDESLTDLYDTHLDAIERFFPRESLRLLEFGAGWDLLSNLYLSACGVKDQTTVDTESHVTHEYLNHLLNQRHPKLSGADRPLPPRFTRLRFKEELKALGITYLAPYDMRAAPCPDHSFDAVISTSVLEHIPVADIRDIMREVRRILVRGGVASFIIDYKDHYIYSDSRVNLYNFLRYSATTWKFFSPPKNFQNRLRHHEYADIFREEGFEILSDKSLRLDGWEELLGAVTVADCFQSMSKEELSWQVGHFVLRTNSR